MNAILFNENSPLLPVTRQKIDKLCNILKRDKLTPWLWFNSRGIAITDFYEKPISISGSQYRQSEALVFWQFIVPFLKDAIVKTLDETLKTCLARKWEPEPYIRETAMLLDGHLIDPIYRYMADIDRRIKGKGDPKSVGRRDVTDEIAEMERFLNKCKDEMIQGNKSNNVITTRKLIAQGESHTLEFKETLEYDVKEQKRNKALVKDALKAIAAFLNTDGGTLLIGVSDTGEVKGIARDLPFVDKKNNDGFQRKLRNLIKDHFNPVPFGKVKITFVELQEGIICQINMKQSLEEEIYYDNVFYIRDGNTTLKLEDDDVKR